MPGPVFFLGGSVSIPMFLPGSGLCPGEWILSGGLCPGDLSPVEGSLPRGSLSGNTPHGKERLLERTLMYRFVACRSSCCHLKQTSEYHLPQHSRPDDRCLGLISRIYRQHRPRPGNIYKIITLRLKQQRFLIFKVAYGTTKLFARIFLRTDNFRVNVRWCRSWNISGLLK